MRPVDLVERSHRSLLLVYPAHVQPVSAKDLDELAVSGTIVTRGCERELPIAGGVPILLVEAAARRSECKGRADSDCPGPTVR